MFISPDENEHWNMGTQRGQERTLFLGTNTAHSRKGENHDQPADITQPPDMPEQAQISKQDLHIARTPK